MQTRMNAIPNVFSRLILSDLQTREINIKNKNPTWDPNALNCDLKKRDFTGDPCRSDDLGVMSPALFPPELHRY